MLLRDIGDRTSMRSAIQSTYNAIILNNPNETVSDTEAVGIETGIGAYCHNLRNKTINYDVALETTDLIELLNDIITHNVVLLVNEFRNIQLLANIENGMNHAMTAANPIRKSNTNEINIGGMPRTADSISFNNFQIMNQQGTQMQQAHKILAEIYKEIQQMIFNYAV